MISIMQQGDRYNIRFKYDPILISIIRDIPSRKYDPNTKLWSVSKDYLGWLVRSLDQSPYRTMYQVTSEEELYINHSFDTTSVIPDEDISDVNFQVKEGCKPLEHQLDFMKFALHRQRSGDMRGFLLADDQGLSKTCEVINLALYNREHYGYKHCLVICCVNSAKYTWLDEIYQHTKGAESGYILGSRLKRNKSVRYVGSSQEKYDDLCSMKMYGKSDDLPYFIIMNIEAIRYKVKRKFLIAEKIQELILSGEINMVCLDEIHKNCSLGSTQGDRLRRISKKVGNTCMFIPMTGTPIVKKPTDCYLPMLLIGEITTTSFSDWCHNFCIYGDFNEIIGYKSIGMLKSMLQSNMLRRVKSDVLDLPPKITYTVYVENTAYQQKLYNKLKTEMRRNKNNVMQMPNPLASFLHLRQVNGSPELVDEDLKVDKKYLSNNAKLQTLLELLRDIHDRGEKVVIFSNWVEPLRTLYRFVATQYGTVTFTGTMTDAKREEAKHKFIEDPTCTVMMGTIGALGVSHTLTVARNVIFYDECWNPSDKVQAEDRIYRIGTNASVNIYTIIAKDTVDDKVHQILYSKAMVSSYIVDNKLDIKNDPSLYDFLVD